MKTILKIGMDIMLWLFYYQTTMNTFVETDAGKMINYHNFAVNTVIFCIPYICSGINLLSEKETISKVLTLSLGIFYMILCINIFSCITLEFILQSRTVDDLIWGIPDLFTISKITIEDYAKILLMFPLLNYLLKLILNITATQKGVE